MFQQRNGTPTPNPDPDRLLVNNLRHAVHRLPAIDLVEVKPSRQGELPCEKLKQRLAQ